MIQDAAVFELAKMSGEESATTVVTEAGETIEGLEIDNESYTVITAADDATEAEAAVAAEAGGTVIEVPVSYTDLQASGGEAIILQEAEDDEEAEEEAEENDDEKDTDEEVDEADDDSDYDPMDDMPAEKKQKVSMIAGRKGRGRQSIETEKCSICGATVTDLAIHIVNKHSGGQAKTPQQSVIVKSESVKRQADFDVSPYGLKPRKRAYTKGKYQQIKPVLRFPCDACKHVSKTSDQLKKHMIMAHKGNKATAWMFCGECEYATRVEEELVNHVKMHQLFSVLKDEMREGHEGADDSDEEEEDDTEAIIRAATGGKGLPPATSNFSDTPMNCGDCDFETHYENELFEHLKMHLRKDANLPAETEEEEKLKKDIIEASVEQVTFYEEDDCLHCGLCSFSSKVKKNMLRHSNLVHGVVINDKGGATITVKQTAYHCTLCKFRGANKEELAQHRKRTIHNKYGGVTAIDPIAEAEERKARIRNNCL